MKTTLLLLFFIAGGKISSAQDTLTKEKQVAYPPLRAFFQRNPSIKRANVYNWRSDHHLLNLVSETDEVNTIETFDMSFIGSVYLFEKKFGKWPLSDSVIVSSVDKGETDYTISYTATYDSILFTNTYIHHPRSSRDRAPKHTKSIIGPVKGVDALEKELANAIQSISPEEQLMDSVFIFRSSLRPDGTITVDRQITSENATYADRLVTAINQSGPWKPYLIDDVKKNCYPKLYVKINKSKTVKLVIQQP